MNINLYGRARRLALYRNIAIIVGCVIACIVLLVLIFGRKEDKVFLSEFELLRNYFIERDFSCEMLDASGSRCISNINNVKTTFYRYDDGFEYFVKTDSYTLTLVHRLGKQDEMSFKTTSSAFEGYKNQEFSCIYTNNVLGEINSCESITEDVTLDIKSYLGVIELAQADITNAVNSSGYSLENLLVNYEWSKK